MIVDTAACSEVDCYFALYPPLKAELLAPNADDYCAYGSGGVVVVSSLEGGCSACAGADGGANTDTFDLSRSKGELADLLNELFWRALSDFSGAAAACFPNLKEEFPPKMFG